MREIKFRAWDKNTVSMSRSFSVWEAGDMLKGLLLKYQNTNNEFPVLMQYTGLKDKNGKEIYEGDIVRVYNDSENFYDCTVVYQVEQWNGVSAVCLSHPGIGEHNFPFDKHYEIIGNIYENQELLK